MKYLLEIFKDGYTRLFHTGELPSWSLVVVYCLFFAGIIHVHEYFSLWMMMFLFLHSTTGIPKGVQILLDLLYSLLFSTFITLIIISVFTLIVFLFG